MAEPLEHALSEAKAAAHEQLHAASQLQIDQLTEHLSAGYHAQIQHILDDRLSDLSARIEAFHRAQFETARAVLETKVRRDAGEKLNQAVRRLRHFESEKQWSQELVACTEGFCQRAALFVVNQQQLELKAVRNLPGIEVAKIPLASAPAFASAVESKDTLIAIRTSGELSQPIADLTGEAPDRRFSLFPLSTRNRIAAILYADGYADGDEETPVDSGALEVLAAFGATVIDGLTADTTRQPAHLLNIFGVEPPATRLTTWFNLSREDQDQHLRAQRFARVQIAEMRLYKSQAVKEGRVNHNLYARLQPEIDAGREAFRRDFLAVSRTMIDYFHLELLRTLANDDASILGSAYPGPLV